MPRGPGGRMRPGSPGSPRREYVSGGGPAFAGPPLSSCLRACGKLQVLLVGLDHLLDHLAADGTGLPGGQVAVVALLQVDAHLP